MGRHRFNCNCMVCRNIYKALKQKEMTEAELKRSMGLRQGFRLFPHLALLRKDFKVINYNLNRRGWKVWRLK